MRLSPLVLSTLLTLSGPAGFAASDESRINPERLWLPPSSSDLRPALEQAAAQALNNPRCEEVLYGRLNQYRSEREEPTLTILCQEDYRTTFNLIYPISELDGEAVAAEENAPDPELEELRDRLVSNRDNDGEEQVSGEPEDSGPAPEDPEPEPNGEADSSRSLELDLEEFMEREEPEPESDPELF